MFQKPFRVKSQTSIKGSDRRKLRAEIGKQFPQFSEDDLKSVVPNKEDMTVMKIYTHSGENVMVYLLNKNPAFFECNRVVYPTVYTLWQHLELMPIFTTWPPVFNKLVNGADLMLPGVVVRGELSPTSLGNLSKGAPCAVKVLGNRAPLAVGKTALSTSDMFDSAMRGKGVIILHTYQDLLWAHGCKAVPPLVPDTELFEAVKSSKEFDSDSEAAGDSDETGTTEDATPGAPSAAAAAAAALATTAEVALMGEHLNGDESDNVIGAEMQPCGNEPCESESAPVAGYDDGQNSESFLTKMERLKLEEVNKQYLAAASLEAEEEEENVAKNLIDSREQQDAIFYHCFLCAVKTSVKKADLPMLTSKFYHSHMLPFCPKDKTLDVKKSSYKKLSKFLQQMQKQGLITVKELSKGVDSVTAIHRDHAEVKAFQAVPLPEPSTSEASATEYQPPQIEEMFTVTAVTMPVFKTQGCQKGDALTIQQIRQLLTDYVKENDLYHPQDKGFVRLDPILSDAVLNKGDYTESLRWDALLQHCLNKMSPASQITFPGQVPVLRKGPLQPVVLKVAQRGGNKKVTLVHNLESFGINPGELARHIQVKLACSTAISALPGKNKGLEVLIQGNQVNWVAELLIDKYQLPRKYLQGVEKGKSGKKK